MSEHDYTRALVDGQWNINPAAVRKAAHVAYPDTAFHVQAKGVGLAVTATPDLSDTARLDQLVAAQAAAFDPMPPIRDRLVDAIDARTRDLIAQGFEYPADSGQIFSLSTAAQANWNTMAAMAAADPAAVLPVPVPFADDSGQIVLNEVAELAAWGRTGAARVLAVRVAGSALKAAVRGYGTPAQAAAFNDGRT